MHVDIDDGFAVAEGIITKVLNRVGCRGGWFFSEGLLLTGCSWVQSERKNHAPQLQHLSYSNTRTNFTRGPAGYSIHVPQRRDHTVHGFRSLFSFDL